MTRRFVTSVSRVRVRPHLVHAGEKNDIGPPLVEFVRVRRRTILKAVVGQWFFHRTTPEARTQRIIAGVR
jgi:hypothetical protein